MLSARGPYFKALCLFMFLLFLDIKNCKTSQEIQEKQNHAFAKKLYQTISEENSPGNLILSPLSLEIVLAVAGLGASGRTRSQISNALAVSLDVENLRRRYSPVLSGVKEIEGQALRIASQIFVDKKFHLKEDFINYSSEGFACGTQLLDFANNPVNSVSKINSWVEGKTEGLIKNLLSPGDVSENTQVVLTNAVYFKGKWIMPFNASLTLKRKFTLAEGNKVDVDMMNGEILSGYGHPKSLNAKVLELPYVGEQLSMVILLPDRTSSIAELESKISEETFDLKEILSNHTRSTEVIVSLPKFKLELTTNLESSLLKLGMTDMFDNNADFSGMTNNSSGLKVSRVFQKAFIEVSEEGTEAAAATGFLIRITSGVPDFIADRPFIFILWHKESGTRLFVGRFAVPENVA